MSITFSLSTTDHSQWTSNWFLHGQSQDRLLALGIPDQNRTARAPSPADPAPQLVQLRESEALGVLNDEKVARWMGLFHPVEVDLRKSDPALAKKLGAGDKPSFVIVDHDLKILAQSAVMPNAKRVVTFLQSSVKTKCGKYWASVKKRIDAQKKVLFIAKQVQPCLKEECPSIEPGKEARYVLEVGAGISDDIGLRPGDDVTIDIDRR